MQDLVALSRVSIVFAASVIAVALFVLGAGCTERAGDGVAEAPRERVVASPDTPPVGESWTVMGTFARVSVPAHERDGLASSVATATEVFERVNALLSTYDPDSEISLVNGAAGGEPVAVSPLTREVLAQSVRASRETDGCFDPTVLPLMRLWGFRDGRPRERAPSAEELRETLNAIGVGHLVLAESTALLDVAGVEIDLGGIAKGYAVDLVFDELAARGVENIMVDLGGNIRCRGIARGERTWRIGVRNPFERASIVGTIDLGGGMAVATSGNYERFVTIAGEQYAHIVDSRTGRPVQGMAGVTVVSPRAVDADVLSTALFIAGPTGATKILARFPGSGALFIPDRPEFEILITDDLAGRFSAKPEFADRVRRVGSE